MIPLVIHQTADNEEGWITPDNVKAVAGMHNKTTVGHIQAHQLKQFLFTQQDEKPIEAHVSTACVTTDFAIQVWTTGCRCLACLADFRVERAVANGHPRPFGQWHADQESQNIRAEMQRLLKVGPIII